MKTIQKISISLIYIFLACSSGVVKFPIQAVNSPEKKVCVKPAIISNYREKTFIVLGGGETEVVLSNEGLKIKEWSAITDLHEVVNYKNVNTVVDYYILVESLKDKEYHDNGPVLNDEYVYRIIDAKSFQVLYSKIISAINADHLMVPFIGDFQSILLSDLSFMKSFDDDEYNAMLNRGKADEILSGSLSTIEKLESESMVGIKGKVLNKHNTELYLRYINAATSSFCLEKYTDVLTYVERAEKISDAVKLKNNPSLEQEYLTLLKQKRNTIIKAQSDSIQAFSSSKPTTFVQFKEDFKKPNSRIFYLFLTNSLLPDNLIYDHILVMDYLKRISSNLSEDNFLNSYISDQLLWINRGLYEPKLWQDVLNLTVEIKKWDKTEQGRRLERIVQNNEPSKEVCNYAYGFHAEVVIRVSTPAKKNLLGSQTFNHNVEKVMNVGEETEPYSKLPKYSNQEILFQLFYPKDGVSIRQFLSEIKQ